MTSRPGCCLLWLTAGAVLVCGQATVPQISVPYAVPGDAARKTGTIIVSPPFTLTRDAKGNARLGIDPAALYNMLAAVTPAPAAPLPLSVSCMSMTPGSPTQGGGQLNGFIPFPLSTGWHRDISADPADSKTPAYIENIRQTGDRRFRSLYPPLATDTSGDIREGVPYHVVSAGQPRREVTTSLPGESDPGPYPIPEVPLIQGTIRADGVADYTLTGDRHIIVLDRDACVLYELFNVDYTAGTISAGSAAVFDLLGGDHQRPEMFTSASVSGLPMFPGMIRGDELAAGEINHPINITAFQYPSGGWFPDKAYTGMASHHQYGQGNWNPDTPPLGSLIRLKPDYDVSSFPPQAQLILNTLKKYGGILTDGGGTIDTYSAMANEWDGASTVALYTRFALTSTNFDVIRTGPIYCDQMYTGGCLAPPTGPRPVINSFTSTQARIKAGSPVTLQWSVGGVPTRLRFVTPGVGPVVNDSVLVSPAVTTTYTLMVQNASGRVSSTVTVTVEP